MIMDNKIRVALCDDQNLFREGLKHILQAYPEVEIVAETSDGAALIEAIPLFDPQVILLDYTMPGMDGFETMQIIKKDSPDLKVIILTMHYDEQLMVYMMKNGADGYLLKDEDSQTVMEAIRTVLTGSAYFPQYVAEALLKELQKPGTSRNKKPSPEDGALEFSRRELEILAIVGSMSRQQMADHLFISIKTIDFHLKNMRDKTNCNSTAELVAMAIRGGYQ